MADEFDPELQQPDDEELLPVRGNMPSFGSRLGAKVQQTPDAAKAKIDQTQNPQPPDVKLDPSALPEGIMRTGLKPNEVPNPSASSPTTNTLPALMQQRSQAATPINPNATDASGKKIYRMPVWQRIVGTGANFLNGFARNGAPPIDVGPGALNNRYSRDTSMQEKRVASLDTDIGNQEKLADEQRKLYDSAIKQAYEGELAQARQTAAEGTQMRGQAAVQNAATNTTLAPSKINLNDAKATQAVSTANQKDATRPTKVMGNRTYEKQDDGTWKDVGAAPVRGTGGRGAKSDFDKIERDKQQALMKAERSAQTSLLKIDKSVPLYDPNDPRPRALRWADAKQQIYEQLQREKDQAQADYEARIQEKGGSVVTPPAARTVNSPPANRVVKPGAPGQYKVGQTVMVNNKPYRVTGINPKTGKPIVAPQ